MKIAGEPRSHSLHERQRPLGHHALKVLDDQWHLGTVVLCDVRPSLRWRQIEINRVCRWLQRWILELRPRVGLARLSYAGSRTRGSLESAFRSAAIAQTKRRRRRVALSALSAHASAESSGSATGHRSVKLHIGYCKSVYVVYTYCTR